MSQKQVQLDVLHQALETIGAKSDQIAPISRNLYQEYSKSFRAYHNMDRILSHLSELASIYDAFENPREATMAILLNSYVFDPRRDDDEERSTEYAREVCKEIGMNSQFAYNVSSLIMATKHNNYGIYDNDTNLVADIDISVFGSPPEKFSQYRKKIRKEYSWMDDQTFMKAETALFEKFHHMKHIYSNEALRGRLADQAKKNIEGVLEEILTVLNPVQGQDENEISSGPRQGFNPRGEKSLWRSSRR